MNRAKCNQNKAHVGFRVNANERVATGHLMRCITLALECLRQGSSCVFLLGDLTCKDMLIKNKLEYINLNRPSDDWEQEIKDIRYIIAQENITHLVVDSYTVTEKYLSELKQSLYVVYMDDFCTRVHDVNAIVNSSQWPEQSTLQEKYRDTDVKVLAGTNFAPLRREFYGAYQRICKEKQIMITTGGTDPFHVAKRVVELLRKNHMFDEYKIIVIAGKLCEDIQELHLMAESDDRLRIKSNVSNMAEIMKESCMAVTAGGMTVYELCACGIPMVCFSFSDDQLGFAKKFDKRGVLLYAGDARFQEDTPQNIVCKLEWLIVSEKFQKESREKMHELVDGKGAARIVKELFLYGK